jgi:hypothetical protein
MVRPAVRMPNRSRQVPWIEPGVRCLAMHLESIRAKSMAGGNYQPCAGKFEIGCTGGRYVDDTVIQPASGRCRLLPRQKPRTCLSRWNTNEEGGSQDNRANS